jgi:hypothetical protein
MTNIRPFLINDNNNVVSSTNMSKIFPHRPLGDSSTPKIEQVPCRQLQDLQPDHLHRHEAARLDLLNPVGPFYYDDA